MANFGLQVVRKNEQLFGVKGFSQNDGEDGMPRLLVFGHTERGGGRGVNVAISRGYRPGEQRVGNLGHFAVLLGEGSDTLVYEIDAGSRWVRWPSLNYYGTGRRGNTAITLEYGGREALASIPSHEEVWPTFDSTRVMSDILHAAGVHIEPLSPLPPIPSGVTPGMHPAA